MSWPPGDVDPAAIPQREGQTVSLSQSVMRGTMCPSAAGDDRLPVLIQPVTTIHTVKIASCLETIHSERFNNGALLSAWVRSYLIYIKLHTKPKLYRKCIPPPPTHMALRPNAGHGLLILEVSRSNTTHHSR